MSRYIDADEVVKTLTNNQTYSATTVIQTIIDRIPTANVERVQYGKWIMDKKWGIAICSECKFEIEDDYFWRAGYFRPWEGCPYCRAKMDGKEITQNHE